jgi:murein tripeptide amidase MpaA
MDLVKIGSGPLKAWVIHRQHPGESMAEWFAEGMLDRLLEPSKDGLVMKLLRDFTFYVVPNMNPDGSIRGHLRTNACGANLNREWATTGDYVAPTLERSPEVFHVLREMDASGVDFFIDVHGDEGLPYNFISGAEGCPNWGPRMQALQGLFVRAYERSNPDMQSKYSYEPDEPMKGNLAICSNQVGTGNLQLASSVSP